MSLQKKTTSHRCAQAQRPQAARGAGLALNTQHRQHVRAIGQRHRDIDGWTTDDDGETRPRTACRECCTMHNVCVQATPSRAHGAAGVAGEPPGPPPPPPSTRRHRSAQRAAAQHKQARRETGAKAEKREARWIIRKPAGFAAHSTAAHDTRRAGHVLLVFIVRLFSALPLPSLPLSLSPSVKRLVAPIQCGGGGRDTCSELRCHAQWPKAPPPGIVMQPTPPLPPPAPKKPASRLSAAPAAVVAWTLVRISIPQGPCRASAGRG